MIERILLGAATVLVKAVVYSNLEENAYNLMIEHGVPSELAQSWQHYKLGAGGVSVNPRKKVITYAYQHLNARGEIYLWQTCNKSDCPCHSM